MSVWAEWEVRAECEVRGVSTCGCHLLPLASSPFVGDADDEDVTDAAPADGSALLGAIMPYTP